MQGDAMENKEAGDEMKDMFVMTNHHHRMRYAQKHTMKWRLQSLRSFAPGMRCLGSFFHQVVMRLKADASIARSCSKTHLHPAEEGSAVGGIT